VCLTKFGIVHEKRVEYKPSVEMHNFLSHLRTTNVMQQSFMVQTKVDCVSTREAIQEVEELRVVTPCPVSHEPLT